MNYPADFKCPISLKLFQDPVICEDGITYEREEILKWFLQPASIPPLDNTMRISPMTKKIISMNLIPNLALKNSIEDYFKNENNEPIDYQPENTEPIFIATANLDEIIKIKCDGIDHIGKYDDFYLSIIPPNKGDKRNTVYINVVDVSGSMQLPGMSDKKEGDFEYSRLDLVKYSLENIVENCEEEDYFALVIFSNRAEVIMPITQMTNNGKKLAKKRIYEQDTAGATNLWGGILAGLELSQNEICKNKNVSMIVLTDGEANENPPRGVFATLETYLEKNPLSCCINTLGFGYDIDSQLLFDIALKIGNGTFCFIPDCTMIGTNVTSLIAKNKTCFAKDVKLKITIDGAEWCPKYNETLNLDSNLYTKDITSQKESVQLFDLGQMEYGQKYNLKLRLKDIKKNASIKTEVFYNICNGVKGEAAKVYEVKNLQEEKDEDVIKEFNDRVTFISGLLELMKIRINKNKEEKSIKQSVERTIKEILEEIKKNKNEKFIREFENTVNEREGQVRKAFESAEWFAKWGLSHSLYLLSSHLRRFNSNFKDPSIQSYGGEIFETNRTDCENTFCTLQQPKPSIHS